MAIAVEKLARGIAAALALALALGAPAAPARAALPVPEGAYAEGAFDDEEARVEARLLVHPDDAPAQGPVRIGVLFDVDPGWHIYWRNPGQSGLPTRIRWSVPGAELAPLAWPAPTAFLEAEGDLQTYGYAGSVLVTTRAQFAPAAPAGHHVLSVAADLLACRLECIPASFSLERRLPMEPVDSDVHALARATFRRHAERVPVSPEALGLELQARYSQSAIRPGDAFTAAIAVSTCRSEPRADDCDDYTAPRDGLAFFPDPLATIDLEIAGTRPHPIGGNGFAIELAGRASPERAPEAQRLRGVLALRAPDGRLRHVEVDLPLPRAERGAEVALLGVPWEANGSDEPPASALGLLGAIGLALLGGLLLNLMPCVLPVLAIKLFALADLAHRSRREVAGHALAYATGILGSMGALAATVIALRAAGRSVGWGFQFQEPLFLVGICAVLVVFAANLFGVFEIGFDAGRLTALGQSATGARRSLFDGLLAVLLATPCSAPFLGTAAGFAFAGSPAVTVAIFLAIGVGLALPLALVALAPGWARIVPRSGPWMLRLRNVLGFLLLAAVVWLLWIVGRLGGVDAVAGLLAFLLFVAFATWAFGVLQNPRRRWLPYAAAATAIGLALSAPSVVSVGESAQNADSPRAWLVAPEVYDPERIAAPLAEGRPVFIYFTADWCITCKLNERLVLSASSVQRELVRLDAAVLRADWTRRDERIRAELARFGKAGVPLYVVYHPDSPDRPSVLPELLSPERLIGALRGRAERPRLAKLDGER